MSSFAQSFELAYPKASGLGDLAARVAGQPPGDREGGDQERDRDQQAVVRGRIRMRAPAEVIGARVPARYVTVAPDGPDACVVTTTGRWSRELLVWMAMMDAEM
ncbi:MAG: hypothetical protein QOF55_1058, partial [Thermoleophilaceae bacterium]|nr:hypothetical protein [Thermoleophilaceae bacterium]